MVAQESLEDDRLIFVISQPRSGSTVLQHVLGSHRNCYTLPEPWFPLHFTYLLRESGIATEYNAEFARLAFLSFLEHSSISIDSYRDSLRTFLLELYAKALKSSGATYFVDKTPRYYFIIDELRSLFPRARFVLLVRHPLAVLKSIVEVNLQLRWSRLTEIDRAHDVLSGPVRMAQAVGSAGSRNAVVRYEDFVSQPDAAARKLCGELEIEFDPRMTRYGDQTRFTDSTFVDPKSIYKHDRPVTAYVDDWYSWWRESDARHAIASAYLDEIGPLVLAQNGYSQASETWDREPRQPPERHRRRAVRFWRYVRLHLESRQVRPWTDLDLSWIEHAARRGEARAVLHLARLAGRKAIRSIARRL